MLRYDAGNALACNHNRMVAQQGFTVEYGSVDNDLCNSWILLLLSSQHDRGVGGRRQCEAV